MTLTTPKVVMAVMAVATVAYGLIEFRGPQGYSAMIERKQQVRKLESENQKLRSEISRLEKRVNDLSHDPAAQELEIRKTYHLVKPGETVYVLQDKSGKTNSR